MAYTITCPIPGCGQLYQNWNGIYSREQVQRSFKAHLTGKHCLKGPAFKKAYLEGHRSEPCSLGSCDDNIFSKKCTDELQIGNCIRYKTLQDREDNTQKKGE